MGNTSSHASSSVSAQPPSATQSARSSTPLPISTSTATGSLAPSVLHSGLTPPTQPPSPPAPATPPLLPYAGHLSPQNPHALSHPQSHDYSKSTVTQLILDNQLAPFYRGLEDYEEDWTEDDIGRVLNEMREKDFEDGIENSYTHRLKEEREVPAGMGSVAKKMGVNRGKENRKMEMKAEREKRERKVYRNAVECPICFLNYPPNINTSRCCQQPVCTECFVQIKRTEATTTHLESEAACCPFCVETDFGVIYERPLDPIAADLMSALSTSPEAGTSSFSALSLGSDAELNIGPGMAPKVQESMRRKSVSSKAKEVVTIDQIRPDWELKMNAVKAAAARRASRRIVMRQVGDRLIPIGFTSSRAPGTADFSMSLPAAQAAADSSVSRRTRRSESGRERDLEEAMRLSMIDHEEYQKKTFEERRGSSSSVPAASASTSSLRNRADSAASGPGPIIVSSYPHSGPSSSTSNLNSPSAASKLFSKFGNRNRSGSNVSSRNRSESNVSISHGRRGSSDLRSVTFATNDYGTAASSSNVSLQPTPTPSIRNFRESPTQTSALPSPLALPTSQPQPQAPTSAPAPTPAPALPVPLPVPKAQPQPPQSPQARSPPSSSFPTKPTVSAASQSSINAAPTLVNGNTSVLPRLSLDMEPMNPSPIKPTPPASPTTSARPVRQPLNRLDTVQSERDGEASSTNYAQLESDEE